MTTTPDHDSSGSQNNPTTPLDQSADLGGLLAQDAQPTQPFEQVPPAQGFDPAPQAPAQHGYPQQAAPQQALPPQGYQQPAYPQYAGQPLPEGSAFQQPAAPMAVATDAGSQSQPAKGRAGMLWAGLAIGALLGGIVGGGVAAVVASNVSSPNVSSQAGGTLTLNNPEDATTVSGVAAVATPSVVTLEVAGATASGSGSGVIIREDGYIITNAHVVTMDGAAGSDATIRVKLSDGRILDGEVVGVDPYADIAVVKVDADSLPAIKVADSSKLNVGDTTIAIGAPLNLANTVTSGVVSALNRGISVGSPLIPQDPTDTEEQPEDESSPWDFRFGTPDDEQTETPQPTTTSGTVTLPVIQTDASINPGNSGGALLNSKGELIGINVAIASTGASTETAGSVGLGFAIPSNLAERVANALIEGDQPSHGLLGASVVDSSQDTDKDRDVAGGLIVEVLPGGAAEKAGLKPGDVITSVEGIPAVSGTSVSALVRMNEGGKSINIEYSRDGEAGKTDATLGKLEW